MAQEPRTPWSRWDLPEPPPAPESPAALSPAGRNPAGGPPFPPQFDPFFNIAPRPPPPQPPPPQVPPMGPPRPMMPPGPATEATFLVAKEPNADDPSFYNCIYGIPNSVQQVVQECHVDVDCCEHTCCDTNWQVKYAWAIVLLTLICLVVIVALIVWLIVWLINRSRDKSMRKQLLEAEGSGPYVSHVNIEPPFTSNGTNPTGTLIRRY